MSTEPQPTSAFESALTRLKPARGGAVSFELYEKLLLRYQELQDSYDRMMVSHHSPPPTDGPVGNGDDHDPADSSGALPTLYEGNLR